MMKTRGFTRATQRFYLGKTNRQIKQTCDRIPLGCRVDIGKFGNKPPWFAIMCPC
jgi:hypothetical protein